MQTRSRKPNEEVRLNVDIEDDKYSKSGGMKCCGMRMTALRVFLILLFLILLIGAYVLFMKNVEEGGVVEDNNGGQITFSDDNEDD